MNFDSEFYNSCITVAEKQSLGTPVSRTQSPLTSDYPGALSDFYGLPSNPISVYRTGDAWLVPNGPQPQRVLREARPICNHPIRDVWPTLGGQVYKFLDSLEVKWSTIDPVRFAEEGGKAGPLYLWVGVEPKSLSLEGAKDAAVGCKRILADAQFPDVEIAFRESVYTRFTGPRLLNHVSVFDPTADMRSPFTPDLGVQIAPRAAPHFEGTGALYLCEGGESSRVFLLTVRHVALPQSIHRNELYERKRGQPRHEVLILGSKAYPDALEAMMNRIGRELVSLDHYKGGLAALREAVEGEDATVANNRQLFENKVTNAEKVITAIDKFHDNITKHWSTPSQRTIGYVVHAPPISVCTGPKKFMEDWALIDLYRDKIDWSGFKGNIVYLGTSRSILPRSFSLDYLSRKEDFGPRLCPENAPSTGGPLHL